MFSHTLPLVAFLRVSAQLFVPFVILFSNSVVHAQRAGLAATGPEPLSEMDLSEATMFPDRSDEVSLPARFADGLYATDQVTLGPDVNLITGSETHPKVTQNAGYTWAHGNTVVVVYTDSRGSNTNYSGVSVSTNGGQTFTRLNPTPFTGLGTNFGTPTVFYSVRAAKWFATTLATGCGGQGLGQWESPDGITWTTSGCVFTGSAADAFSTWVDNNPASPFYGRQYAAFNNFAVSNGAPQFTSSTDDGVTWSAPFSLVSTFRRVTSVSGSLGIDGSVFVQTHDEGGGTSLSAPHRGYIYRSTNGGASFTEFTQQSATYLPPGRGISGYFGVMYNIPSAYWRTMGWGQTAVGPNNIVHHVYSARPGTADVSNIYYVRSADNGATWSGPAQLNTDITLRAQWSPSISVNARGYVFVSWYDERNTTNVDRTTHEPTLQRFGRASRDNGLSWTADTAISDVIFPIPLQPDPAVLATNVGFWETPGFSNGGYGFTAYHTWTDGRVFINGAPQQDVFIKKITFGPILLTARSRLTHGAAGTFSVDLPLTGTRGVEPRLGPGSGAERNYTIVFEFDQPINGGTATLAGIGSVGAVSFVGTEMIVQLTGVTDGQTINLTAQNITTPEGATLPSASVRIGFLGGDVTGNGSVTSSDIGQVKSNSGAGVNAMNFRNDVVVNGSINATDIGYVKSRSGASVPP